MKMYYKLTVTAEIPYDVKIAYIHAFCLMEVSNGKKWITLYGMTDDIVTACDLLNAEGYIAKKTWYKGGNL